MLKLNRAGRYGRANEVEASRNDRRADGTEALRDGHAQDYCRPSCRDIAPRREIQETVHAQSSKAWTKTEAEIRFPRPCRRRLEWRRRVLALTSQRFVGKTLPDYLRNCQLEASTVIKVFPVVVA